MISRTVPEHLNLPHQKYERKLCQQYVISELDPFSSDDLS